MDTTLRASDLMERDIITVSPETPILDIHRLFVEEEIHGAPVVGEDGIVYGVVSALDLLRVVRDELEPGAGATEANYYRDEQPYSGPDWQSVPEDLQGRMQQLTASDAMTKSIVMVSPDAGVEEIARTMREQRIHRVLVGTDRMLDGVLTTFDLLRVLTDRPQPKRQHATGFRR